MLKANATRLCRERPADRARGDQDVRSLTGHADDEGEVEEVGIRYIGAREKKSADRRGSGLRPRSRVEHAGVFDTEQQVRQCPRQDRRGWSDARTCCITGPVAHCGRLYQQEDGIDAKARGRRSEQREQARARVAGFQGHILFVVAAGGDQDQCDEHEHGSIPANAMSTSRINTPCANTATLPAASKERSNAPPR